MSLILGTRIGPYELLAKVGEGGMGAVYRAHDSRLNREVAIKGTVVGPSKGTAGTIVLNWPAIVGK